MSSQTKKMIRAFLRQCLVYAVVVSVLVSPGSIQYAIAKAGHDLHIKKLNADHKRQMRTYVSEDLSLGKRLDTIKKKQIVVSKEIAKKLRENASANEVVEDPIILASNTR